MSSIYALRSFQIKLSTEQLSFINPFPTTEFMKWCHVFPSTKKGDCLLLESGILKSRGQHTLKKSPHLKSKIPSQNPPVGPRQQPSYPSPFSRSHWLHSQSLSRKKTTDDLSLRTVKTEGIQPARSVPTASGWAFSFWVQRAGSHLASLPGLTAPGLPSNPLSGI